MPRLQVPPVQNFSCHSCSHCCRHHVIELSAAEKKRLETLRPARAMPELQEAIVPYGDAFRLAHGENGACVFLRQDHRCAIHAEFGEQAKPLACRIFPYALHPVGNGLAVSLRFSCPSVAGNLGLPVSAQTRELSDLARLVVPDDAAKIPAPAILADVHPAWPDFERFVRHLVRFFRDEKQAIGLQVVTALRWIDLIEKAQFDQINGSDAEEILSGLAKAAENKAQEEANTLAEPTRLGRTQFRTLVYQYARKDTVADLNAGLLPRLKLLWEAIRFSRSGGVAPPLAPELGSVPKRAIEEIAGSERIGDELLRRYFRVKLEGLHFCGRGYYDLPFVEGFRHLALVLPATLFMARWAALTRGEKRVTLRDIAFALGRADHHHGYSPALGNTNARRRVRLLASRDDIARLCSWYSR